MLASWNAIARSHIDALATWLLLLSLLAVRVGSYHAYIELTGLAFLAVVKLTAFRRDVPPGALYRIILITGFLTLITCAYLILSSWPSGFGTTRSYDSRAFYFVVTYASIGTYAALFFEERLFERIVWRAATAALWLGVLSWLVSRLTDRQVLVSLSHGALRMCGTMSEPSAWAPVLTLIALLAIRRRSWLILALAVIGDALADSPICVMVILVTLPIYYGLTGTRRQRMTVMLAVVAFVPVAVLFVQAGSPRQYLDSNNRAEVAAGRLLSGLRNIETGGRAGHNPRFADTIAVISAAQANHWIITGAGPAADDTYFRARFPSGNVQPTALWVSVLFDFGVVGVALLGIFALVAVWRQRLRPQLAAILLPFFVASLINSAEGSDAYAFVALGILLFTCGWIGQPTGTLDAALAELPSATGAWPTTWWRARHGRLDESRAETAE